MCVRCGRTSKLAREKLLKSLHTSVSQTHPSFYIQLYSIHINHKAVTCFRFMLDYAFSSWYMTLLRFSGQRLCTYLIYLSGHLFASQLQRTADLCCTAQKFPQATARAPGLNGDDLQIGL